MIRDEPGAVDARFCSMTEQADLIESASAIPWEHEAVFGIEWRTASGLCGAFAAGTRDQAEALAKEVVGIHPHSIEVRYGPRIQRAGEAARDYRRRQLLGLDHIRVPPLH